VLIDVREAITFMDYESISDLLLFLGQGCSLKMNVNLGNSNKDKERSPMSNEYVYRSNKYINKNELVSVKRKFFPYLSLEYPDQTEILKKGQIMISAYDILGFQEKIKEVDMRLLSAFAVKKNELIMVSDKNFEIISMPSNNIVSFSPTIIISPDMTKSVGVKIQLNKRVVVDIADRTWKAFVYFIMTADLYGWGTNIVSGYVSNAIGKTSTDMSNISKNPHAGEEYPSEVVFKNSQPISNEEKRKSFFDD